ncbi:rdmE protein product [Marssonina coronariae]|uniref:RdmE protein product n=1 Tax=Diplocarpon coronariae TaxID=2795749 RepID=A0A218Z6P6_9HELO|nr:rdmE protein product [Marssonina coronariae]
MALALCGFDPNRTDRRQKTWGTAPRSSAIHRPSCVVAASRLAVQSHARIRIPARSKSDPDPKVPLGPAQQLLLLLLLLLLLFSTTSPPTTLLYRLAVFFMHTHGTSINSYTLLVSLHRDRHTSSPVDPNLAGEHLRHKARDSAVLPAILAVTQIASRALVSSRHADSPPLHSSRPGFARGRGSGGVKL